MRKLIISFSALVCLSIIISLLLVSCGDKEIKGFSEEQQATITDEIKSVCKEYIDATPTAIFDDDTKDVKVFIEGYEEMPVETKINLWCELDAIESFRLLRITDGIDEFFCYIDYGGEYIKMRKNDVECYAYTSMSDINYKPYSILTKYQKYLIGDYIQRQYDSYDAKEGKYTGDKYTEIIFKAAMALYGKTYDQINDAWANYNRNKNSLPTGNGLSSTNQVVIMPLLESPETGKFDEAYDLATAMIVTRGQQYTLPINEIDGYYFQGFYIGEQQRELLTDADGKTVEPWTSPINQRIYAKYTKAIEHSFVVDGAIYESGENAEPMTIDCPEAPQKEGYRFDGWAVNEVLVSFPYNIETSTEFVAQFTAIEYTITYTGFESDNTLDTKFTVEDLPFVLPVVQKDNALYKGWSESSDASNAVYEITTIGHKILYPKWDTDTDGLIYGETDDGLFVTNYYGTDTEVIIPMIHGGKTVVGIYANAFENSAITKIVIPTTVTAIGDSAFKGCSKLVSIQLSDNILSIGTSAFANCVLLEEIDLPSELTVLKQSLFSGCYALKNATFGNKITKLEFGIFSQCKALTQIELPDSIEHMGGSCFSFCDNLVSIKLPANLVEIGSSAFSWCDSLEAITIPAKVEVINNNCFEFCDNLKSVTFEDTTSWYTTTIWQGTMSSGLKRDVTSPTSNAVLFNGAYNCKFYWYKY